jgi:hypothetical protein
MVEIAEFIGPQEFHHCYKYVSDFDEKQPDQFIGPQIIGPLNNKTLGTDGMQGVLDPPAPSPFHQSPGTVGTDGDRWGPMGTDGDR